MTSPAVSQLFGEVVEEYDMSMKVAVLKHRYKNDDELRSEYKRLRLPQPPPIPAPLEFGKVYCPSYPYVDSHRLVSSSTLFVSPRSQRALACITRTWHEKIKETLFMDVNFTSQLATPCTLDAFKVRDIAVPALAAQHCVLFFSTRCPWMVCVTMVWLSGGWCAQTVQRRHTKALVDKLSVDGRKNVNNTFVEVLQSDTVEPRHNFYANNLDQHLATGLHRLFRAAEMIMSALVSVGAHRCLLCL